MMTLSEKTAYRAVAFAARHRWAKPLCFGVYSAVYADKKSLARRITALAAASAFAFVTVPTSYAAALADTERLPVPMSISSSQYTAENAEAIAERISLEGLAENDGSYAIVLNIRSLKTDVTARFTSSDKMKSNIKAAFEGYGISSDELCIFPVRVQLYRNDTREKLRISDGYSADITLPVPEEMYGRIDELRAVRLEEDGTLAVIEGETARTDSGFTFTFRTDKLGVFAPVTYKTYAENIGSGAGSTDTGIAEDASTFYPKLVAAEDKNRFGRIRSKKRIYRIKRITKIK